MADHDDDATPDIPSDEPGPDEEPEAGADPAPDDTTEGDTAAPAEPPADPDEDDAGEEVVAEDDEAPVEEEVVVADADGEPPSDVEEPVEGTTDDEVGDVEAAGEPGTDGELVEDTAEQDVVDDGDGVEAGEAGDDDDEVEVVAGRPGWVVPFLIGVAVVVAVVLGVVALAGGGDDDDPAADDAAGAEEDEGTAADTTVGTPVPPVTTAPGTPTAGLLSELEPVDSDSWEPAEDDVTIGGAAHAETVVSGPIGTCDDGAAQTVTYDLAGAYTWLEGVVGLVDGTETGLTVEIGFEADGEQVWWQTFAEGESTRVQMDVTDYRELTVTAAGLFPGTDAGEACVRAAYGDLTLR